MSASLTTLVSGLGVGGLMADADGDLFGIGGASESGTLLEIVKTPTGFASTADQV
jgi:hypothetical protein